ncbi:hypothetical protein EYF80_024576 [Liparis tanakae]|uniref:Uncharacterized protein n=1 Tax=Liparis tanakae TaxID=230148 RepID=A0A4Z2HH11_9TELE|nr:hypothetical protein EYF80_024576 [Liparis tanakae]
MKGREKDQKQKKGKKILGLLLYEMERDSHAMVGAYCRGGPAMFFDTENAAFHDSKIAILAKQRRRGGEMEAWRSGTKERRQEGWREGDERWMGSNDWRKGKEGKERTWIEWTGLVHLAHEELQANDGVDDDDEEDQQGDMEQRNHGFDYGVQHYLKVDRQLVYCSHRVSDKRTLCVSVCVRCHCGRTRGVEELYQLQSDVHFCPNSPKSPFTPEPHSLGFLSFILFFLFRGSRYLLGTPETSLRGLSTLNALRALTSKPAAFPPIGVPPSTLVACSKIALNNLQDRK